MEEDDDEFYGPESSNAIGGDQTEARQGASNGPAADKDDTLDAELESGEEEEEEEEEESDSDIEIITDRPQEEESKPTTKAAAESTKEASRAPAEPSSTRTAQQQGSAAKASLATPTAPGVPQQLGTSFPEVRTSTIDVNADPIYPPVGKTVSQIDIDADLAESTKPWRLPGADQSDYFNYGFDEFTWEMYRQKQASMASTLTAQKAETEQFQRMFGAAPMPPNSSAAPPVPGAPTGPAAQNNPMAAMGGMGGMGGMMGMNEEQMMQAMQAAMMQQGVTDPSQLDFNAFMASMGQGMPGQQQPPQQQANQGYGQPNQSGYGNYGQGQGGGGNYGGGGRGGGGRRGGRW
ncbi:uncharacterized protein BDZ99DRAFT_130669 [Mytilinidion resinicola]|uniref:Pre-mRNA polyadenylation factor Fip1 domain-containing protein n=1 Tax=Mytilinidion resinicola TaxID=574789 RepID=A0A6A6Z4X9_9PEZI|nr:uncharacterized protein BDZ99DRAFT_130669 [Mytilinidion resinicola]KAF2816192.1 hypothetical protein BDZ99DRAFT_130669 [Mytilinidion resinicola]